MRCGSQSSGRRGFGYRRAAMLAEISLQIQCPSAEAADHCSRRGERLFKGLPQQLFVNFQSGVAEAGARRVHGKRGAWSEYGRARNAQSRSWRHLRFRARRHRRQIHCQPCRHRLRRRRYRTHRGHKSGATLKAEAHSLRTTRMALRTGQHTFAANQRLRPVLLRDIITPCATSQDVFGARFAFGLKPKTKLTRNRRGLLATKR